VTDTDTGIVPVVRANGAIPARNSAFAVFPEFKTDPYRLFRALLQTTGRPRPRTPHYATLTQHVARALRDIAHGTDVRERLQRAAEEIQRVIDR
jgi:multiple sugar transport system substrate-binding protein